MPKKVNIAVIGTGRMGSIHVRNLARLIPEANLAAICDIRLEVAQAVANEVGIQRVVKDYHELLEDEQIEAILIATSTDTHAFIIKDVAAAKKHIFCEKPLALDLPSIDSALAVVEKAGVKLQVGFNRRFDKSFRRVREVVASGEIGRPCILRITNRDPDFPAMEFLRVSGGMFLDMTIHDFDMTRFLSGSEVEEVYAIGDALVDQVPAYNYDVTHVYADYTNPYYWSETDDPTPLLDAVMAKLRESLGAGFGTSLDYTGLRFNPIASEWPSDNSNLPWIAFWRVESFGNTCFSAGCNSLSSADEEERDCAMGDLSQKRCRRPGSAHAPRSRVVPGTGTRRGRPAC